MSQLIQCTRKKKAFRFTCCTRRIRRLDGYDRMRDVEGEEQRKQPRKRRAETDEECIEEMFSQVVMEQEEDWYHVV